MVGPTSGAGKPLGTEQLLVSETKQAAEGGLPAQPESGSPISSNKDSATHEVAKRTFFPKLKQRVTTFFNNFSSRKINEIKEKVLGKSSAMSSPLQENLIEKLKDEKQELDEIRVKVDKNSNNRLPSHQGIDLIRNFYPKMEEYRKKVIANGGKEELEKLNECIETYNDIIDNVKAKALSEKAKEELDGLKF